MPRIRETLSARERVRLALAGQTTDRIPIGDICAGFNPPVWREFELWVREREGREAQDWISAVVDTRMVWLPYAGRALKPGFDFWGVGRKPMSYGEGSYDEIEHYPLAAAASVADVAAHDWPRLQDFDMELLGRIIRWERRERQTAIVLANFNPFETAWYMRGLEAMMTDVVEAPEVAHAILERVTAFYESALRRCLEAHGKDIDLIFAADDVAGQNGLLLSLPMLQEFVFDYHRRINQVAHEYGATVAYHSDGAVTEAVPALRAAGIDALQALQFSAAGMNPVQLKALGQGKLGFIGGVCVQQLLPFGTEAQVRAEVRRLIDILGQGGGYVLGPAHCLQAGTPAANIWAMYDEALSYYPHRAGA